MRKLITFVVAVTAGLCCLAQPSSVREVFVEGGSHHVQGIAYDQDAGRMYFSFTDTFIVTDMDGNMLGSVNRIQGHLGAMTFDRKTRKVYASLECKDDVIGQGLSDFAKGKSMFYIAVIDVDKVKHVGMDSEDNEAFKIVCVKDATREYKDKASRDLTSSLEYGNTSYSDIFEILADLSGGEKQLARIIPANLEAQQAMVSLLMRRRLFDDALELTERLLKKELEPKNKLNLLQTKCTILEMADRHEDRAQAWKEIVALETSQLPIEEVTALYADGESRNALNLLLKKRGMIVLEPTEILLEAQIQSMLGKYEEVVHTLMRLAYLEDTVDRDILDKAQKLMGGEDMSWKDFMLPRVKFLEMALTVKRGTQAVVGNTMLATRLELLEKETENARPQWLQRHLVPYYAGLVWEANGKMDEAMNAYRRCLDICPNHLWSMEHLSNIDNAKLTDEESNLLAVVTKRLSPIAAVTPGLQWVALSASPDELTELYTTQDFEYIFLCVADVNSHLRLNIQFGDKKGGVFSDRIEPMDGSEYTLRVGELMRIARKGWQPQTMTLTSRRRVMANGDVVARYGKFTTKAFKVNVKGGATPSPSGK